MRLLIVPVAFLSAACGVLLAGPKLGFRPPPYTVMDAIEFVSLLFFAGLGASLYCIDLAKHKLALPTAAGLPSQPAADAATVDYKSNEYLPDLMLFGLISAGALAMGGGTVRRLGEAAFHSAYEGWIASFRPCYKAPSSAFWPNTSIGWSAVGYGAVLGTILGVILTWSISGAQNLVDRRDKFNRDVASMDGFGTAFFAAYGINAAVLFYDGFPWGTWEGIPAQWHPLFTPVLMLISFLFGGLTACGGGLVRNILIEWLRFGNKRIDLVVKRWAWGQSSIDTVAISGIGCLICVNYFLPPRANLTLACAVPDEGKMAFLTIAMACLGFGVWAWRAREKA